MLGLRISGVSFTCLPSKWTSISLFIIATPCMPRPCEAPLPSSTHVREVRRRLSHGCMGRSLQITLRSYIGWQYGGTPCLRRLRSWLGRSASRAKRQSTPVQLVFPWLQRAGYGARDVRFPQSMIVPRYVGESVLLTHR
ncbi:hypothetical protein D3C81_1641820 [compost metagenome]